MHSIQLDESLLARLHSKTAIVAGACGGIGTAIVQLLASHGANVVLLDLPHSETAAKATIATLSDPSTAMFIAASTTDWSQLRNAFKQAKATFGQIDVVVANAGIMEHRHVLDMDLTDENGDLEDAKESSKVIDVNLKGTLAGMLATTPVSFDSVAKY